jgi:MraZ protein
MARGRYQHVMDAKGRVSIPAGFRVELQAQDERPPILTTLVDAPALGLFAHERWLQIEDRLASMSQLQPEVQAVQRMLVSNSVECPLDGQGRILIPPHLRASAELERDVTIAGVGARIEIWNTERFEGEMSRTRERSHEIASIAAQLGL